MLHLLCLLSFSCHLFAADPPKPAAPRFQGAVAPEIWALRDDPRLLEAGALILEDRWRFGFQRNVIERTFRVRILANAGRQAVELQKMGGATVGVEGRVAYPDGTFLVLNRAEDLTEKLQAGFRGAEVKRTILVPPGITSDCVFELHLTLNGTLGSEKVSEFVLGNPFPTREMILEMGRDHQQSFLLVWAPGFKAETIQSETGITAIQKNLPALDWLPFQSGLTAVRNRLFIYWPQRDLKTSPTDSPADFWNAVAKDTWKSFYRADAKGEQAMFVRDTRFVKVLRKRKGPGYEALVKELLPGLPAEPQALARELHSRLAGRIQRWSHVSREEARRLKAEQVDLDYLYTDDYEGAIKLGGTHSRGWLYLYYQLLQDAGVHPYLLYAVASFNRPFVGTLRSTAQFDWTLLAIHEPGKPVLLIDTDLRFGLPGEVSPAYQGTMAVAVNTVTWEPTVVQVGWQTPELNSSRYAYTIAPQGGFLGFELRADFQGALERKERMTYLWPDAAGGSERLLKWLATGIRDLDACVDEATVGKAGDPKVPFAWSAKGRMRLPQGERLLILPAPGLLPLLWVDQPMAAKREEPLYFGPPQTRRVASRIRIPAGYRWPPQERFERSNPHGTVVWEAALTPGGEEVLVTVDLTVNSGVVPAAEYGAGRRFLAWQKEAGERRIMLERIR